MSKRLHIRKNIFRNAFNGEKALLLIKALDLEHEYNLFKKDIKEKNNKNERL